MLNGGNSKRFFLEGMFDLRIIKWGDKLCGCL